MILSVVLCHMANLEQALNVSMLDWNAPRKNSEVETEAGLCWFTNNVEFLSSLRRIFQSLLFDFNELSNPPQWELFFSLILKMSRFCIRPTSYIEWVQEPHAMILLQNLLSCCRLWFKFLREVCMCMPSINLVPTSIITFLPHDSFHIYPFVTIAQALRTIGGVITSPKWEVLKHFNRTHILLIVVFQQFPNVNKLTTCFFLIIVWDTLWM